jgi:hypothetical protein
LAFPGTRGDTGRRETCMRNKGAAAMLQVIEEK